MTNKKEVEQTDITDLVNYIDKSHLDDECKHSDKQPAETVTVKTGKIA